VLTNEIEEALAGGGGRKVNLDIGYIDHNTVQVGFENFDDHKYLTDVAKKYSDDPSAADGGDVGFFKEGTLSSAWRPQSRNSTGEIRATS
jgi:hypothetical protein